MFESCFELKPAFDILFQRSDKLSLVPGEMFPASRSLEADVEGTQMENVEHLGQYVYEMTQAKIKTLGEQPDLLSTNETTVGGEIDEGNEENDASRETVFE